MFIEKTGNGHFFKRIHDLCKINQTLNCLQCISLETVSKKPKREDVKYVKYRRAGLTLCLYEKSGKEKENLKSPVRVGGLRFLMTSRPIPHRQTIVGECLQIEGLDIFYVYCDRLAT